ncbi:MAG: hypothetical protein GOVbin3264_27 [Prokaryotic dsDNA virus sp.]|nr:MAG: hypothetical protein GOVbin3264_27 [Prokaryotic dsDNA virus sp.]
MSKVEYLNKFVSINYQHKHMLWDYLSTINLYIEEATSNNKRYKEWIDIANIIIEHHNNYKSNNLDQANYSDFLSIIPSHFSCMCNGYLAGLENKDNRSSVRLYRHLINEKSFELIDNIAKLETIDE